MVASDGMAKTACRLPAACLALVLAACGADTVGPLNGAGESCTKTTDCQDALMCANLVCVQAEATDVESPKDTVSSPDSDSSRHGGTWTDPISGLIWQVTPTGGAMSWADAKAQCASLGLGGHSDWHLPSIGELRTLIRGCPVTEDSGNCNIEEGKCMEARCRDESCGGCSRGGGPGTEGIYWPDAMEGGCCSYWSSSPVLDCDGCAWSVGFHLGVVNYGSMDHYGDDRVDGGRRVRCVRRIVP